MNSDDIRAKTIALALRYSKHPFDTQKIRDFSLALTDCEDADVFHGLYPFFEICGYSGEGSWHQEVAGRLLVIRMPEPQYSLKDLILKTIPYYNLSIEQLPWYLALRYGVETFRAQVDELREDCDERSEKTLDTYLWWTSISEQQIRNEIAS